VAALTRHTIVGGWLRLFLGWLQMSLVAMSVGSLAVVGLHSVTWVW